MGSKARVPRILGNRMHQTLFGPEEEVVPEGAKVRGRNPEQLEARNMHLLYRYEWYMRDKRNAYAWVLEQLSKEFYLNQFTVSWVVNGNWTVVAKIKTEALSDGALKKKFPWW